jgi:hypothetical protein
MTSLFDVPARQATQAGGIDSLEFLGIDSIKTFTNSGSDIIQRLQPSTTRIYPCLFLFVRMDGLNWFLLLYKRRGNREHYESMYCKLERFAFFFFLKSTDDYNR